MKALEDDNFIAAQMVQLFFDRMENIGSKGENADYQHFLIFTQCFIKSFFPRTAKSWQRVEDITGKYEFSGMENPVKNLPIIISYIELQATIS